MKIILKLSQITKPIIFIQNLLKQSLLLMIVMYQYIISPLLIKTCRFYPSCSEYVKGTIKKHGLTKGLYWSIKRILKCRPYGEYGFDPIK